MPLSLDLCTKVAEILKHLFSSWSLPALVAHIEQYFNGYKSCTCRLESSADQYSVAIAL